MEIYKFDDFINEALITFGGKAYPKYDNVVILAGGAGCFDGETEVHTFDGLKKIKDVKESDLILTFNENTKQDEYKELILLKTFNESDIDEDVLELEFENGQKVICTESHEFYVNGNWVKAKDLSNAIKKVVGKRKVYDLKIKDNHNYYITKDKILVHNSGKGFQLSNLLGIEGKILNVDDLKTRAVDIAKRAEDLQKDSILVNRIKTETGIDLTQLDFKNPSDVNNLHIAIKKIDLDNNLKTTLINSIRDYQYKPNLIFDVTLSDMEDLEKITKQCREMGYAPENIHIVWVINSIEVTIDQNNKRSRVVPAHILLNTHQGAATTMRRILELGDIAKSSFDGDIWFTFNKFVKNAEDNDVESRIGNTTKYTKSAAIYIEKANYIKIKNKGQRIKKYDEIGEDVVNKINQYSKNNFK